MTTYPSPARVGEAAYIMLRSTSVVMTTIGASPLTEESPVSSPTLRAPWRRTRSAYFWLERALIGVV